MQTPTETTPRVRATIVRLTLARLRRLDAPVRDAILARIPERVLGEIDEASPLGWLDAGHQAALQAALFASVTRADYVDFWKRLSSSSASAGVFGEVARGAMRIFGATPRALFHVISRVHRYATRGLGFYEVVFPRDEHSVLVRYHKAPRMVRSSRAWLLAIESSLQGVVHTLGLAAQIEVDESQMRNAHELVYTIRWGARHSKMEDPSPRSRPRIPPSDPPVSRRRSGR